MSNLDTRLRQDNEPPGQSAQRPYLDQGQASEYLETKGLKIAPKTLGKLRVTGGGPAYRLNRAGSWRSSLWPGLSSKRALQRPTSVAESPEEIP
jgi:hypothetical protein